MVNFFKAYSHPDKYSIDLPLEKIVAVDKVDMGGIQRIIHKVKSGESIKTIVVVKHPEKEYFAVLDGHHRFWALKELGMSTIKCAVVEDSIGLGFYLTKKGVFQPNPKITKYIRIPLKRFNQYITDFIKTPEKLIKKQKKF
jgi:hypothetical protein